MKLKHKYLSVKAMPYWMIAPACILLVCVVLFPILRVFGYSTLEYNSAFGFEPKFTGLNYYVMMFTKDRIFGRVLGNSLRWVVFEVVLQLFFGCITALLLNQSFKGRSIARAISLIPWAVSGVLTAILWSLIYNEHVGLLNDLLIRLGITNKKHAWLGDFRLVFPAVVVAELWRGIPFFTISLLASLQSISTDLYEAAQIDGATYLQRLLYVIFSHLKDTIMLTTLLRTVWEFNSVDVIFNLTGGGPANMTMTLSMYISNQAIKGGNYGYGSALSTVSFLVLTVFAIVYLKLGNFAEIE